LGTSATLPGQQTPAPPALHGEIETEEIQAQGKPAAAQESAGSEPGQMDPEQVKALLKKIWLSEYRIRDLLTEVHPERWELAEATRQSLLQTLEMLRTQLDSLAEWRSRCEQRPESIHFTFETYLAIAGVLPRLEAVAQSAGRHVNASFGAQFHQALNQLADLGQALQPYLSYLLSVQDQLLHAAQTNLAACQGELSRVMRGKTEPAKPMKMVLPQFKGRRLRRSQ